MLDAEEIAQAVNSKTGDSVSARMVREYVRLDIIDKALHPGRKGFDGSAVGQMLEARRLVHSGLGLEEVAARMQSRGGPQVLTSFGRSGRTVFWVGLGDWGRVGLDMPKTMDERMASDAAETAGKALAAWAKKNKVRSK